MPNDRPVALVTGGVRRVGRAIVMRLARDGYDIAATYLTSENAARDLTAEFDNADAELLTIRADLADPPAAVDTIERAFSSRFDRLDVLVNNASDYTPSELDDIGLSHLRRMNAIHLESPLLLCQRFAPALRASLGSVVNLCDLMTQRPSPRFVGYLASKGALEQLTRTLARSFAPDVTVNGIAPGAVAWPEDMDDDAKEKYLSRVPLRRVGSPDDVAALVSFLAREGKYITGEIIRVDGGRGIA